MRNLLIVLLAAAVVWLFMERVRLSDELAAAKTKSEELEKYVQSIGGYSGSPGAPGAPRTKNWLNEHIDRGARTLDTPKTGGQRH